jgi:hypothetical protein
MQIFFDRKNPKGPTIPVAAKRPGAGNGEPQLVCGGREAPPFAGVPF